MEACILPTITHLDPLLLGVDWVASQLHKNPRTRHLQVGVRAEGATLVLEGWVPTVTEKLWAEQVARRHQSWGRLENRIDVFDGSFEAMVPPAVYFKAPLPRQAA
jgi:hypothetical protein